MNAIIATINAAGQAFIEFALPMLIQSSVLILILLAVDILLRRRVRAVFRYWIWMLVLVKLVLPPSLWSPVSLGTWLGETLEPPQIVVSEPSTVEPETSPAGWPPQAKLADGVSHDGRTMADDYAGISVRPIPEEHALAPEMPGVASATDSSPMATPDPDQSAIAKPAPDKARLAQDDALQPSPALGWQALILLVWLAVASALLLLLIQRAWFVRGLVAQAQDAPQRLKAPLDRCRSRMGLRRPIAIRVSSNATSPAVCGLVRPCILMPSTLLPRLQPHDLDAVLLHELAHIKRGDLWVNLIQTLLQIVYFYNPFLWLANTMIRRIREQAVDEAVLVAMGETAPDYPETLLHIAKLAFHRRPALSLRLIGVVESKSALRSRIKHILTRPVPKSAKLGTVGLIAIVITAAVLLPMARAERDGMHIKGIDEILNVSDSTGYLTIHSLHMPAPDGKRLVEMNETLLQVGVENTSQQDSYLGLEYYADAGTVAGAFSPGASARTEVLRVPANWQGTLTYPVAYPRFVRDGYLRIVLAKCSDLQTTRSLSPEAEVLHEKTYPVFTDKQSQDSGDRFALLPDCGVWLSDIDGQALPVLDLASESIITLPKVESDFRLLQTTASRGEGDVLYYYDRAKGLPKITFLRGAALGDASASDKAETRTVIPPELPWQATLTTAQKASYEIRITRADEHGCAIYFRPVEDASDLPKAILPDGIVVELLGLSEHPSEGTSWWRPDGSVLEEAPYDQIGGTVYPDSNQEAFEFAIRLRNLPSDADTTIKTEPGGSSTGGSSPPRRGGEYARDMRWLATSLPKNLRECQLLVGIAAGPWETTASATGESYSGRGTQLGGVMFSQAVVSDGDSVTITVSDDILERPCRVVTLSKDGRTLVASPTNAGTAGQARQTTAYFKNVAIDQIAEFQFQTRPWTWVTFRNVSLKPGHETDVAVDAQAAPEDREPQVSETDTPHVLSLTARAERVMPLAEQEARRLNHGYVGTEHILLALARQEDAVSAKVLANLGADLDRLRAEVNQFVRPGARATHASPLPRMPRAERAMQYAKEEARTLGHDYIGTEHILLALLHEEECVAAQVLASLNVARSQVRTEVFKLIRPGASSDDYTDPSTEQMLGSVEGQVIGPDGKPLPNAPLSLTTAGDFGLVSNALRAVTDEAGRFRIDNVPPGTHLLYYPWSGPTRGDVDSGRWRAYHGPGERWPSVPVENVRGAALVEMDEGRERCDVVVDLSKSTCSVEGRVFDSEGRLAVGAEVHLFWKLPNAQGPWPEDSHPPAVTDSEGRYRLVNLPPGDWHIAARHRQVEGRRGLLPVRLEPDRTIKKDLHLPQPVLVDAMAQTNVSDEPKLSPKRRAYLPDLETPNTPFVLDLASGQMLSVEPMRGMTLVLPDVDREAVMLDLASGQLVAVPHGVSEANLRRAILDLGKGDLVFDARSLVLVRGTTSQQAEKVIGEPFRRCPIGEHLPQVLLVTTAEQRRYRITVLEIDQGRSCTLESMRFPDDEGAGGGALVDPPQRRSSGVVAKLPNGVTVEFLAYSQLTAEELRWWTLDGESTTIPDVYQADVEGHGVLLALRIEPEPEYALAWSYQPPDIRHALKFWRMEGSNIWLAALGQQRNYVNVEIYARLKDPPAVQSVSIQEKDADGEIRIGAHGSQKIIGLTAVDSNTTQFLVTSMVDGPRVVAAQDTSGRLHRVRLLSEVPLPRDPSDPKGQRYQVDMSLNDLAGIVIEGVAARGGGVKFRNIPLTGKQPGQLRMEIAPGDEKPMWYASGLSSKLKQFGTALSDHAASHAGGYPAHLSELRDALGESGREFVPQHVTYLGMDKTPGTPADTPLACVTTLLPFGFGTYVLYSDGRVEFESPPELAELGLLPDGSGSDVWQEMGVSVPPDANDARALTSGIRLDGIGSDPDDRVFISTVRDTTATEDWQYRFVLTTKRGETLEPIYYASFELDDGSLWEKCTFDTPYQHRKFESFRLQRRLAAGQVAVAPTAHGEILSAASDAPASPVASQAPPGRYALAFDGKDDYLYVPDSESLRTAEQLKVEMWFKPQFPPGPYDNAPGWALLAKGAYLGTGRVSLQGFGIALNKHDDRPDSVVFDPFRATEDGLVGGGTIRRVPDDWMHFSETFQRDSFIPAPGQPLVFGRFLIPTERPFQGQIAEIRLWDAAKSGYTPQYEKAPLTGTEPALLACWTFEEGAGPIARDLSPNANHARLGSSIPPDDADPTWFDLQAPDSTTTKASGRVVDPNGAPVAGAQVGWIDADRSVSITDGRLMAPRFGKREGGPIIETDERGSFRFEEEPNDGFSLLAAHEAGFALIGSEQFAQDRVIRLQRWGRIEGQVAPGREPLEGKIWMGGLPNSTWFEHRRNYRYEAICDSEGRFTFDRVPPGWFEVGYLVRNGDFTSSLTSRTPVVVEAGATATVTLGGEGRPVRFAGGEKS